MRLAFLLPFIRTEEHPLFGPPLSMPTLVGGVKNAFPNVHFEQIDLSKELEVAVSIGKIDKNNFLKQVNNIEQLVNIKSDKEMLSSFHPRQMTDNRYRTDCYIPTKEDMNKFKFFLAEIVEYANLDKFDHYFFSVYKINEPDVAAAFLLARFLKQRNKDKKIIFGGMRNFSFQLAKKAGRLDFIDALVIGDGVNSVKEIIHKLKKNQDIDKTYRIPCSPKEVISFPDYKSFRNLDKFGFKGIDLEKVYNFKIAKRKSKKLLFIPYKFSLGCFWSKCSYCGQSASYFFKNKKPKFYTKSVKEIISDLLKLKETCQTNFFIFYNNNFNSSLEFSKKLLKAFIKNKIDIIWTDSFNPILLDDEMIDLLAESGCIRADIGIDTFNNKLQKFYHNILQDDIYLKNLEKISRKGIWVDINLIANLPYCYSSETDLKYLKKFSPYIDGITINSYRTYSSELTEKSDQYGLIKIDERALIGKKTAPMYFIEDSFKDSIEKRKKLFARNYLDLVDFVMKNKILYNQKHFYLLGYLYSCFGLGQKKIIKEYMLKANGQMENNEV